MFLCPGDGLFVFIPEYSGIFLFLRYEALPGGSGLPALKDLAVVKTRLQRVSTKAGAGSTHGCRRRRQQPAPTSLPHLQVVEELSQCSHSIYDFQAALDGILSELVQHGQQAHEDKRFVERLYQNTREGFAVFGVISGPSWVARGGYPNLLAFLLWPHASFPVPVPQHPADRVLPGEDAAHTQAVQEGQELPA